MKEAESTVSNALAKRDRYNPIMTAEVRQASIREALTTHIAMAQKASSRTNLSDVEAVRNVAEGYLRICQETGSIPSMETLSAALGCTRMNLYKYIRVHPGTPTVDYLDTLRTLFAGIRQDLMERRITEPAASIFVLKNSDLGYSDRVELTAQPVENPLQNLDEEAARRRILESLPEPDDD